MGTQYHHPQRGNGAFAIIFLLINRNPGVLIGGGM